MATRQYKNIQKLLFLLFLLFPCNFIVQQFHFLVLNLIFLVFTSLFELSISISYFMFGFEGLTVVHTCILFIILEEKRVMKTFRLNALKTVSAITFPLSILIFFSHCHHQHNCSLSSQWSTNLFNEVYPYCNVFQIWHGGMMEAFQLLHELMPSLASIIICLSSENFSYLHITNLTKFDKLWQVWFDWL